MSDLRRNAQYFKFEATPEARKRWITRMLSQHLKIQFGAEDINERFCNFVYFKSMTLEQRDLMRRLARPVKWGWSAIDPDAWQSVCMSLVFPDGRVIELQKNIGYIDMREPHGEWQGTMLKHPEVLMRWIVESNVRLLQDSSKR